MDSFILPGINSLWFSVFQAILAENKEKLPVAINPPVYAKDKVFKYVSTNKTFSLPGLCAVLQCVQAEQPFPSLNNRGKVKVCLYGAACLRC